MPAREIQFVSVIGSRTPKDLMVTRVRRSIAQPRGSWWGEGGYFQLRKERGSGVEKWRSAAVYDMPHCSLSQESIGWKLMEDVLFSFPPEWKPFCFNVTLQARHSVGILDSILTKQKTWNINLSCVDDANILLKLCVCRCECVWAVSHLPYQCQGPGTSSVCLAEEAPTQQHVGGVGQQNKQHPHPVPGLTPCLSPLT